MLVRHGLFAVPVACHLLSADHELAGDGRLEGQAVDAGVGNLLATDLQLSKTVAGLWFPGTSWLYLVLHGCLVLSYCTLYCLTVPGTSSLYLVLSDCT